MLGVGVRHGSPVAAMAAAIDLMETAPTSQFPAVLHAARELGQHAAALGQPALQMRARLLYAEALLRQGDTVDAGRIGHQVLTWATGNDDHYLLARSHRLLSAFFRQLGDPADALAHAVQAVAHTGDDVAPGIRARHLLTLAAVLDENGSTAEGARRFGEALDIATATGDHELALYALNDMAYTAYENGDESAARHHVARLRALQDRSGSQLTAHHLDTIARVEMMGGRYAEAVAVLAPVLAGSDDAAVLTEGDALAECLLTAAEALRRCGRREAAHAMLDRAQRVCRDRDLAAVGARVREQRAHLFAATGHYRRAYEEHCAFHAEARALQSAQREARARALQAVFEADEARRTSDRFRELAHRDALTGLHNRRYVNEQLPVLLRAAAESGRPLSAALVDLDHFKRINDTLSHDAGDAVLQQVGRLLADAAGEPGVVARMGGEEFLLLFPDTDATTAVRHCEAIRTAIRSHPWGPVTGHLPVTASIGVTTVPDGRITGPALLSQADRNLYTAKRAGRDRVTADAG